nr:hypothetical protein [Cytophagales bacterium]
MKTTIFLRIFGILLFGLIFSALRSYAVKPSYSNSPIEHFRFILNLSSEDLEKYIVRQKPHVQAILRKKVEEYASLSIAEKDFRLRATELHYYLDSLLEHNSTVSLASLPPLPESLREEIMRAVHFWNNLSNAQRDLLFTKKATISYLVSLSSENAPPMPVNRPAMSSEWANLYHFLQLPYEKQKDFLGSHKLNKAPKMQKVLEAFSKMSMDEKERSANALVCFLSFPRDLQDRVSDGLTHWNSLDPSERTVWREIAGRSPTIVPMSNEVLSLSSDFYPPFPVKVAGKSERRIPFPPLPSPRL